MFRAGAFAHLALFHGVSIDIRRFADLTKEMVSTLQQQIADYYSNPPAGYYVISDQAADHYTPETQPFHCDLVSRIKPGTTVLELGCGSAHLCPFVETAGGSYTGMDHSIELLSKNREHFPRAQFFPVGEKLDETFDVVASLYTIEHVVDPKSYLETMWDFCKPGGLIAIICPAFGDGEGLPPSVYYGTTPRRFREKIASLSLADAWAHLLDLYWVGPQWQKRAQSGPVGAFWINLRPRILFGADYSIDADAVHFPRLKDLVWWFDRRNASVLATSQTLSNIPAAVLKYNCYLLIRKPNTAGRPPARN
jgi:SAM-dependent methyltransferase